MEGLQSNSEPWSSCLAGVPEWGWPSRISLEVLIVHRTVRASAAGPFERSAARTNRKAKPGLN